MAVSIIFSLGFFGMAGAVTINAPSSHHSTEQFVGGYKDNSGPPLSKLQSDQGMRLAVKIGTIAAAASTEFVGEHSLKSNKTTPTLSRAAVDFDAVSEANLTFEKGAELDVDGGYFLICGSALGVYRDGANPEGDDDIDVAIPLERLGAVQAAWKAVGVGSRAAGGHAAVFAPLAHVSFWGYTISKDGGHLCFGCFEDDNNVCKYRDAYPIDLLLPAQDVKVTGVEGLSSARLPHDIEAYLKLRYNNWRTPEQGQKPTTASMNERFDQHCLPSVSSSV